MRTQIGVVLILAIALSGMMFAMSGFNDVMGYDGTNSEVNDKVNESYNDSNVRGDDFSADSRTDNSGSLVGFIITGTDSITKFTKLVVLLPFAIQDMGFPYWFAYPIGVGTQILVSIGFIQFAANRVWR